MNLGQVNKQWYIPFAGNLEGLMFIHVSPVLIQMNSPFNSKLFVYTGIVLIERGSYKLRNYNHGK